MIEQILEKSNFPSSFNIEDQKKRYEENYGKLPDALSEKNIISKEDVIQLIKEQKATNKEELLIILFWGVYFKAVKEKPKKLLINFINSQNFDVFMDYAKKEIIDSDSPSDLYKKFSKRYKDPKTKKYKIPNKKEFKSGVKAFKIPGIEYAYFTKIFFFYREALVPEKKTYLILDKWLSRAWCAIDGSINNNTEVFDSFYSNVFDGTLSRQKPLAYSKYIEFMEKLAMDKHINIIRLEEKLFGVDSTDSKRNDWYNPRDEYIKWAENNKIKLKSEKEIKEESLKVKNSIVSNKKESTIKRENTNYQQLKNDNKQDIIKSFVVKETEIYLGLYVDFNIKRKEGYIDKKGWLCASEILKSLLASYKLNWEEGNTQGGSKEKYKTKFKTKEDCIKFLKDKKIISQ